MPVFRWWLSHAVTVSLTLLYFTFIYVNTVDETQPHNNYNEILVIGLGVIVFQISFWNRLWLLGYVNDASLAVRSVMLATCFSKTLLVLQPYYKSQPIPADWNARAVKILVGANFREVALDVSKHVFVMFCKHRHCPFSISFV